MTRKRTTAPELTYKPRNAPQIAATTPEQACGAIARLAATPELAAMRVVKAAEGASGLGDQIDVPDLMECLRQHAAAVNAGELTQAEAMLMNQATALQSLFARLTERAMGCDTIPGFDVNMRMALRAQSQCRATLETLATIKNPPVVIAKQANVTTGPQQVNNGLAASAPARQVESGPNKLLTEAQDDDLHVGVERWPSC